MYSQSADAALKGGNDEAAKALRGHIKPVFSGTVIYRFIIRKSELTEDNTNQLALNHSGMTFVSLACRGQYKYWFADHLVVVVLWEEQGEFDCNR